MADLILPKSLQMQKTYRAPKFFRQFDNRWHPQSYCNGPEKTIADQKARVQQYRDFNKWLDAFGLPRLGKSYQAIRIIGHTGIDKSREPENKWYRGYIEGVFFVWRRPLTVNVGKHHTQLYVLNPHDVYHVWYHYHQHWNNRTPRKRLIPGEANVFWELDWTIPLTVPVEFCQHMSRETIGGSTKYLTSALTFGQNLEKSVMGNASVPHTSIQREIILKR